MNFILTLISLFILTDLLWWGSTWRRLKTPAMRVVVSLFAVSLLAGLAMVLGSRWMNANGTTGLPRPLISVIFLWHLLIALPWLVLFVSTALVRGVRRLLVRRTQSHHPSSGEVMARREWIKAGVTLAPAVLTAGGAIFGERQLEQFRLRRLILPISGLPPSLDGLTIAHVSDVHVGHFTRGAVLERIVRTTNDLKADLVLMTGDLINLALRDLPVGIDLVRGLRGREGVFLCEGNHDLMEDPVKFRRQVRRAGLPFLLEEGSSVAVHGTSIQVLGTAWSHTDADHAESMERLRALRDPKAFHIVLAHHPHAFDFADDFPLVLAGHTHGGQLMLTQDIGCGPWMFRYWSGEYRRPGRTLVVSNGVGNWFPVRINAPAEILHLTLRPA